MVEGVVKDVDGESKRMTLRPHTWNVVWLQEGAGEGGKDGKKDGAYKGENKAVLVDCCWGARRVIDDSVSWSLGIIQPSPFKPSKYPIKIIELSFHAKLN